MNAPLLFCHTHKQGDEIVRRTDAGDPQALSHFSWQPMLLKMLENHGVENWYRMVPVECIVNSDANWVYAVGLIGNGGQWIGSPTRGLLAETVFERIPPEIMKLLRDRRARLLLDNSSEAMTTGPWLLKTLHKKIDEYRLHADRVVFLTQDLRAPELLASWRVKIGRMNTLHVFPFQQALVRCAGIYSQPGRRGSGNLLNRSSALACAAGTQKRERHFLCFNRRPKAHRLAITLYLLQSGYHRRGLLSYCNDHDANAAEKLLAAIPNLDSQTVQRYLEVFNEHKAQFPLLLDWDFASQPKFNAIIDTPAELFGNSYFSIITESDYSTNYVFRFTEKTWKSIANFHPFILVGEHGALSELRRLGFRTFHPLIDESYDTEKDPARRLALITDAIDRICRLSIDDVHQLYTELWPAIEHNERHFYAVAASEFQFALKHLGALLHMPAD